MADTGQDDTTKAIPPTQIDYTSINGNYQMPHSGIPPSPREIRPSIHHDTSRLVNTRVHGQNGWQTRGRSDYRGRSQGRGRAQATPPMVPNHQSYEGSQPPSPPMIPLGLKYDFNHNPIISPWEKRDHNTSTRIHWGNNKPLDNKVKGPQYGPTEHTGIHQPIPNTGPNNKAKLILRDTLGVISEATTQDISYNGTGVMLGWKREYEGGPLNMMPPTPHELTRRRKEMESRLDSKSPPGPLGRGRFPIPIIIPTIQSNWL